MGAVNNLNQGDVAKIWEAIRALQVATPLNSASIGAGGLRVYDGGVITIQNGGLVVTGEASIVGRLIASGIIDFTGDVTISGPLDVEGLMTLVGDLVVQSGGKITAGTIELNPDGSAKFGSMTISPAGKITSGSAEINPDGSVKFGNLEIDTTGKVTAGGLALDPGYLNGALRFDNGTYVASTPNGAQLVKSGGGAVTVSSGQADMGVPGGGAVIADGSGVALVGISTTSSPANAYIDPVTGRISRSTA